MRLREQVWLSCPREGSQPALQTELWATAEAMLGEGGLLNTFHHQEQRQSWNQGRYRWKWMKTGIWTWRLSGFGCKLILVSHSAAPPGQIKTYLNFRKAKEIRTVSRNKTARFLLIKYKSYLVNMQLVNTMCNTSSKNEQAQKLSGNTEQSGFIFSLRGMSRNAQWYLNHSLGGAALCLKLTAHYTSRD